jgi:hypothetical protein
MNQQDSCSCRSDSPQRIPLHHHEALGECTRDHSEAGVVDHKYIRVLTSQLLAIQRDTCNLPG